MSPRPALPFLFSFVINLSALYKSRSASNSSSWKPLALLFVLAAAVLSLATLAGGQTDQGTPSFSAYDSHQYDTINLQNLTVVLNVPGMSKSGAFPLRLNMRANYYVYAQSGGIYPGLVAVPFTGTVMDTLGNTGSFAAPANTIYSVLCPNGTTYTDKYVNWYIQFADGTTHWLPSSDYTDSAGCFNATFTDQVIDGTGYSLKATGNTVNSIYDRSGLTLLTTSNPNTLTDSNGNSIKWNFSNSTFTDTLGLTALTGAYDGSPSGGKWSWTDVNGGSPAINIAVNATATLRSNFACTGLIDYDTAADIVLPTGISFPDGSSLGITYEQTNGYSGDYTGRLGQLTLRSGGTISYNYNPSSGSHDGLNCTYQVPNSMTRTTSDGTTTYTWALVNNGSGHYGNTTTVVDNGGNKTVYTFTGLTATGNAASPVTQALTQVQHYQGSSTLLTTDVYCYNGATTSCVTAVVSLPVTEVDVYHTISGMSNSSRQQTQYDGGPSGMLPHFGNRTYSAQYDFGAMTPTQTTTIVYGSSNGSGTCSVIGNNVNNKPCTIITNVSGATVGYSQFTYDPHGNLLKTYVSPNGGGSFLSNATNNSYNPNGTPSATYDLANNPTTYFYNSGSYTSCGSCTNYPFPSSISNGGLTTSSTWNGVGGAKLTDTDANGNTTSYCYTTGTSCSGGTADPFWRVLSATDPLGYVVYKTYPSGSSPDTVSSSFSFNSGNSIQNTTVTTDGYGRKINSQTQQGPLATNYDTVSTEYAWSGNYRTVTGTLPCTATSSSQCSFSSGETVTDTDPLGRPYTVTDGGGGTLTNTYAQNDVLIALGPAPSFDGENVKQVQKQFDGLGRITKSCAIGNGSSTPCGQNTGSANGVTTSTSYSSGTGYQTVSFTRGSQTRSTTTDGMGRVTQKATPETNNVPWTYVYDSNSSCPSGYRGAPGLLASSKDPDLNLLCFSYDSLNRVTGTNANGTTCRHFYYDNSTGYSGTLPTGVTLSNQYGRMVEAATDSCTSGTLITDEWFNYDKDGHVLIMWEKTPNSGGYYKSTATFYGNGAVSTLQLSGRSFTGTYGLDGEGRANALTTGSTVVPTNGVTFYPGNLPHVISIGTGSDNDTYTYDSNTNRMTGYSFTLGSKSDAGTLTWNAIGTLKSLAITDGFNSGGTQTCNFGSSGTMGYDDLNRLLSDVCGSGGSIWNQTYSYDQYDNLTKSSTGFVSWNPGYNFSNNHYTCTGCTYDSNGNVTNDGTTAYTWNEFSKMASTNKSGTNCASAGQCIVYDAMGRIVEIDSGSTYTSIWHTQLGKTAYMNGSTYLYSYWPAPGGGTALHNSSGTVYFMHKDWLGNVRLGSNLGTNIIDDYAFAPYGEKYDIFGSTSQNQTMFTGDTQDVLAGMYDTPNRELQGSQQGRWLSPDPAGAGWNLYAYTTNPNGGIDPSGLKDLPPSSWYLGFAAFGSAMASMDAFNQGFDNWINSTFGTVPADGPPSGSPTTNTSTSTPQFCGCLNDLTSGVLAGMAAPLPDSLNPSQNVYSPGDPAGVQMGPLLFEYQGPSSGVDPVTRNLINLFPSLTLGTMVDVNVWQGQVVDAAGIPVQGTFNMTENLYQLSGNISAQPGSWTTYPNGSFVDNIGVNDRYNLISGGGTGYMNNIQTFYVNNVLMSTINLQYVMYGQGTLGMGQPNNIQP